MQAQGIGTSIGAGRIKCYRPCKFASRRMPQAEVAFNNLYSIQVGNRSMTIDYMVWMILSDASSPAVVRGDCVRLAERRRKGELL